MAVPIISLRVSTKFLLFMALQVWSSVVMCQELPVSRAGKLGNNRHHVASVRSNILAVLVLVLGPFHISANLHFCRVQHAPFRFGVDDDTVSDF